LAPTMKSPRLSGTANARGNALGKYLLHTQGLWKWPFYVVGRFHLSFLYALDDTYASLSDRPDPARIVMPCQYRSRYIISVMKYLNPTVDLKHEPHASLYFLRPLAHSAYICQTTPCTYLHCEGLFLLLPCFTAPTLLYRTEGSWGGNHSFAWQASFFGSFFLSPSN